MSAFYNEISPFPAEWLRNLERDDGEPRGMADHHRNGSGRHGGRAVTAQRDAAVGLLCFAASLFIDRLDTSDG